MNAIKMIIMAVLAMAFALPAMAMSEQELKRYDPNGATCRNWREMAEVSIRGGFPLMSNTKQALAKCDMAAGILATRRVSTKPPAPAIKKAGFTPWWEKR